MDTHQVVAVIRRYPVWAFLVLAYAIGWSVLIASVQAGVHLRYASALSVVFGLALPAFVVTGIVDGRAGVADLLRRCFRWRVHLGWYLFAVFGLFVATLAGAAVLRGPAALATFAENWPALFWVHLPELLLAVVLIQLSEEAGWSGFAQHRLQQRYGALLASLIVAPAFAIFHVALAVIEAPALGAFLVLVVVQVVFSVFFRVAHTWLYNATGRSVLLAAVFHSSFNAVSSGGGMTLGKDLIGAEAGWIPLIVIVLLASVVAATTRGKLSYSKAVSVGSVQRPSGVRLGSTSTI